MTATAVELSANGDWASLKKYLNRSPKTKHDRKGFIKGLCVRQNFCTMWSVMRFCDVFFFKILLVRDQELLNCGHENTNFT